MDLIERYLHAVKSHLPIKQQEDVIAELGEHRHRQAATAQFQAKVLEDVVRRRRRVSHTMRHILYDTQ